AERQPVLFVLEDAHWSDPTTLELLELAIEQISDRQVLMLVTHRPEFSDPWTGHSNITKMPLGSLNLLEGENLVKQSVGRKKISKAVRNQIAEQAGGVPLYVEELANLVLEIAKKSPDPEVTAELPATLQDILNARLDRLGTTTKEIAQAGAVIGPTFEYAMLSFVVQVDDTNLHSALDELVRSKLVTARGKPPNATYKFKNTLAQDAAYASLDPAKRTELHGRVANALKDKYSETAQSEPELLAHHFTEAGMVKPAIAHRLAAGRASMKLSAKPEAIEQLKHGLELLTHALS
ncbi:MAG: adenylate cyclase, partial [Rhodospirillales bacterium]|nr:adenylate cyclase [Rhodospirillales bacterium]